MNFKSISNIRRGRSRTSLSYKARNIIVLASFNLMILLFGSIAAFWFFPDSLEAAGAELNELEREVRNLEGISEQYYAVEKAIQQSKSSLKSLSKQLASDISPTETYRHFLKMMSHSGDLGLNLHYSGNVEFGSYGYHVYSLKGETEFSKLFAFISYLEKGPYVYEVENISFRSLEGKDARSNRFRVTVPFDISVRAYYAKSDVLPAVESRLEDIQAKLDGNPFYPHIRRELPANVNNLVDLERSELRAIVAGNALIADATGKMHMLGVGDKVYLGYITGINTRSKSVTATLNKGGIWQEFSLKLRFDN